MSASFIHEALASRIVFGSGALDTLAAEADRLGIRRALVLCTPEQQAEAKTASAQLGPRAAGLFAGARMHTPVATTESAVAEALQLGADGLVAIGGGSTTGLSKAIALRTDLPQIVIPTTYAGSEVTPILGETQDGRKQTQRSARVLPETVIYDPDLTVGLPVAMSVTSGLNAMAHAAEALYAAAVSPVVALMAEEAIRAMARALPTIVASPTDAAARADALYAAWLSGTCLGQVGMGLHHKLCHVLGGAFDLPHAETHAIVLPHALAYNLPAAPDALRRLRAATGWDDPAMGLFEMTGALGVGQSLKAIGMPGDGLDLAADLAMRETYPNPRPLERTAIHALLRRALDGDPPHADGKDDDDLE